MNSGGRLAPSFLPTTAVLEMTYRCNHRCLFCSCPWEATDNGFEVRPELDPQQWQSLIKRLAAMGVCNLAFTGGEALLKESIYEIMSYAASCRTEHIVTHNGCLVSETRPPRLFLISNGVVVTSTTLEFCRDFDVQLSMSLPGLATLREHIGVDEAPELVLSKFRMARDMGLFTIVNITVTRRNLYELYEMISSAFLAGAQQLLLNRFLPGGRGLLQSEWLLSAQEVVQMLDIAEEALMDAGRFGSIGTELPKCLVQTDKYRRLTVGTRCAAARDFFVVGPSGFIRVCNHSPLELVQVSEIESLRGLPYWKRFTQKDYLPETCAGCDETAKCDGGCREAAHIVSGAPNAPDPLMDTR